MLETIKRGIVTTPKDGAIYLVEKLSENTGFFVTNGHLFQKCLTRRDLYNLNTPEIEI